MAVPVMRRVARGDGSVLGLPSANHRMRNLPTSPSRRRGEDQLLRHRQEEEEGTMFGFTENYVKVKFPFDSKRTNTFQSIRLLETDRDGIMKVELINTKETV